MIKIVSKSYILNKQVPWRNFLLNFSSLSLVQVANLLLPLVAIPYLYKVLGVEQLGYVFLGQAYANFFVQIVDYGFTNTAVRQVAQTRSTFGLKILTGHLLALRVCLLCFAFVPYILIIIAIPTFKLQSSNFLFSYLLVAGQALSPYWFFQGVEKIKYHALLNLFGKVLFVLMVFMTIKIKTDYYLVNAIQGASTLLFGLFGWVMIYGKKEMSFDSLSIADLTLQLTAGFSNFISSFVTFCCCNSYLMLTWYFTDAIQSGYYGLAEKVFLLSRALPIMIHQSIYAYVCKTADDAYEELRRFFITFYLLLLPVFIPITLAIYFFSNQIIALLAGNPVPQAASLLKIVSPISFLAAISIPLGQILLAKRFNRSYLTATLFGSITTLTMSVILISQWQATGAAIAALFGEVIMIISLVSQIEKKHKNYSLFVKPI